MRSCALRSPEPIGTKRTAIVHVLLDSNVAGQLFVWVNCAAWVPENVISPMLRATLPLLVSTMSRVVLIDPPAVVPKSMALGLSDNAGASTSTAADLMTEPSLLLHESV